MRCNPLSLAWRFVVVGGVVLWLGHAFEHNIVASSLPGLRAVLSFVQNDFTPLGLDLAQEGPNETLRLRADYSHPMAVGGQLVYPINPTNRLVGWLQVNVTLGGLLQYGMLVLIAVLAWPAADAKELVVRVAIAVPTTATLLVVNAVITLLAELWGPLHQDLAPHELWPLIAWSKFLMGGGGAMLALALAAAIIIASSRLRAPVKDLSVDITESHSVANIAQARQHHRQPT